MGESVCVCVSVCDVEQLECSTRTTEIFPRTSLYITQKPSDMPFSFFSCLFPELAYKLNHPQSHRAGILILKVRSVLQSPLLCTTLLSAS